MHLQPLRTLPFRAAKSIHRRLMYPEWKPKMMEAALSETVRSWCIDHQKLSLEGDVTWMGVRAIKLPLDAWIYQEIIHEVRPDVIIEIGSRYGGSAQFLCNMLDLIGGDGIVVTIDLDHSEFSCKHPRVRTITGDCSDDAVIAQVAEFCKVGRVLAIHDGDHSGPAVFRDLEKYARFVSVGSYFIVEDGITDLFPNGDGIGTKEPGPLVGLRKFLAGNPNFVSDRARERYSITWNPEGFLKRIS